MHPIVRNILAVVAGIIIGMVLNYALVFVGSMIVPLPAGLNTSNMESYNQGMYLMRPVNFVFPFLAHALGTLLGAFVAAKIAASHHMKLALGVGVWFLIGGSFMVYLLPSSPVWFIALDLLLAYIPMAYLGGKLGSKRSM